MSISIETNAKFACLALENASWAEELREPVSLGKGLWALAATPFELNEHWQAWLGSIQSQRLSRSNFLLVATAPSAQPANLDHENEVLVEHIHGLFYAVLMHGVPDYQGGLILKGANVSGTIEVRSVSNLETHYRPAGALPTELDGETLKKAAAVAGGMRHIYAERERYIRLKRGIACWTRAVREFRSEDRLHQFVRALEALIKPEIGKTQRQFVHRCQIFAGRSEEARRLLEELYDLRSCSEHLNDWEDVLAAYPPNQRNTIASMRAFQAELLAGDVYTRVLSLGDLREVFVDDVRIEEFWSQRDNERIGQWGQHLDVDAKIQERYRPFD